MCFISDKLNKKVASHNIIAYKVLVPEGIFKVSSAILGYPYLKNTKNTKIEIEPKERIHYVIDKGYHSYMMRETPTTRCGDIYEVIIPKGTTYYESDLYREYVSENIIIKRRLTYEYEKENFFRRNLEKIVDFIICKFK